MPSYAYEPFDLMVLEIAGLMDENDKLKLENAKLRERIHELEIEGSDYFYRTAYAEDANRTLESENASLKGAVQGLGELCDKYKAENAELRKLARGLNWCTENAKVPSAECEHCPLGDTFFECGELSCEKLMRELGIEVDDG